MAFHVLGMIAWLAFPAWAVQLLAQRHRWFGAYPHEIGGWVREFVAVGVTAGATAIAAGISEPGDRDGANVVRCPGLVASMVGLAVAAAAALTTRTYDSDHLCGMLGIACCYPVVGEPIFRLITQPARPTAQGLTAVLTDPVVWTGAAAVGLWCWDGYLIHSYAVVGVATTIALGRVFTNVSADAAVGVSAAHEDVVGCLALVVAAAVCDRWIALGVAALEQYPVGVDSARASEVYYYSYVSHGVTRDTVLRVAVILVVGLAGLGLGRLRGLFPSKR